MSRNLLKNFYTELSSTFSANNRTEFIVQIRLDPSHPVYKGHFEQVPIAPGVCLTQVIQEILSAKFEKKLRLLAADNIKFLSLINPNETSGFNLRFTVNPTAEGLQATCSYESGQVTFLKFKGKFVFI
jgi:3-hydroxyacyl-[acyl-carrier-protein] dehydratase